MSQAQIKLINRLDILYKCSLTPAVTEGAIHEVERNDLASLFRNGLSVMAFAITEEFLRERVAEVLRKFNAKKIKLQDLSSSLQDFVTLEALKGLNFRVKFEEKSNRISWLLPHVADIAKARKSVARLSQFSFGNSSSNISDSEIPSLLKAFGATGGWDAIDSISKKIGCGGPAPQAQLFSSLAKRRHSAAHDVTSYISHTDLLEAKKIILGSCVPFDLLLSQSVAMHNSRVHPYTGEIRFSSDDVKIRRVSLGASGYVEQIEHAGVWQTQAAHTSLDRSLAAAKRAAKANHQHVVFLDASGFPRSWSSWTGS